MNDEELVLRAHGLALDLMSKAEVKRFKEIMERVVLHISPETKSARADYSRLTGADLDFLRDLVSRLGQADSSSPDDA